MILYEETDESDVEILHIASQMQDSDDEYRYPRAGNYRVMRLIFYFHSFVCFTII